MTKKATISIAIILSLFFLTKTTLIFADESRPNLDILLLFDHSYSMFEYNDGRMYEAQVAATNFIGRLDSAYDRISLIRFSDYAEVNKPLGTKFIDVNKKINSYHLDYFSNYTNLQKAIIEAVNELTSVRARPDSKKLTILLSDGNINRPKLNGRENINYAHSQALQEAENAKNKNIIIHTVAVGGSYADHLLLSAIADRTGGKFYIAASPIDLIPIYEHIANTLTTNSGGGGGSIYTIISSPIKNKAAAPTPISIDKSDFVSQPDDIYYEVVRINSIQEANQKPKLETEQKEDETEKQGALILGLNLTGYKILIIIAGLVIAFLVWFFMANKRQPL